MRKIIVYGIVILFLINCDNDEKNNNSDFIQTLELNTNDCQKSIESIMICFDKVLNDSRCATGAQCVWEGNAKIELRILSSDNLTHKICLNTNSEFEIDTIISNKYILLTDLSPYPQLNVEINPNDYIAQITIANIDELKSNAQVIDFNTDKCNCCWGWTIKVGNDTIKSDDNIIGKIIGYDIDYPINVYMERGEMEQTCSNVGQHNYYQIKRIVKVK